MSLLFWRESISALATALSSGEIRVVLGTCQLRLPPLGGRQGVTIACSAVVALDSKLGFDVEIQGPLLPAYSFMIMAAALQVERGGAYRLRGEDAEGAIWFARDLKMQVSTDEVAGVFRAKLAPSFISVRSPVIAMGDMRQTEIALDAEVKLPALDYSHEDDAFHLREPRVDAGRIQSNDLDLCHALAGRYRVISVGGAACSTRRSLRNLLDAIAFVNGRRVDTELTRVSSMRGTSLHIHRRRPLGHVPMPPLRWGGTSGMRRVWRTLRAFWRYAESHEGVHRPKMSQVLAELHGAQSPAYISAKALIAAVAVEGLVNHYIRGQGARSSQEVAGFKKMVGKIELPDDVMQQCLNSIGYMTRANAAGRLRALSVSEVIPDDVAKSWIASRPKLAHGNSREGTEDAATFLASQTLCHAIVLGLIGVEDEYEARSVDGRINILQSMTVAAELREPLA